VIVQSDVVMRSTVLVAPTSRSASPSRVRPEIAIDGTATRVLIEQVSAVSTDRLGDFAGRLSPTEITAVDRALRDVFGLMS
jgi:mRNA interferase MazF